MGLMMMIILVTVLVVTVEYVFTPLLLSLRFLEVGEALFDINDTLNLKNLNLKISCQWRLGAQKSAIYYMKIWEHHFTHETTRFIKDLPTIPTTGL